MLELYFCRSPEAEMLYSTPPLRIARLVFTLRPRHPMYMALAERGNALRGGFGSVFRQLVCDPSCPGASNCPRRQACPYACLFEPLWPQAASKLGTLDLPRPFVFRPPLRTDPEFSPTHPLIFELRLLGAAIASFEFFIRSFQLLAEQGLGHARAAVELVSVESLFWDGSTASVLYRDGELTRLPPLCLDFEVCMQQSLAGGPVGIEFVTPTLLKEKGVELAVPSFSAVVTRIRDRISHLCLAYEGMPWQAEYGAIGEAAFQAAIASERGGWQARSRVSSRTRRTMPLSGYCGVVTYKDVAAELLPLLLVGQEIHVGRHAAWGNGWFRLQGADPVSEYGE